MVWAPHAREQLKSLPWENNSTFEPDVNLVNYKWDDCRVGNLHCRSLMMELLLFGVDNVFTLLTCSLNLVLTYYTLQHIIVEVLHLRQAVLKTQASRWGRRPSRLAWVLSTARLKCKTFFEYCEPAHIVLACIGCIIYLLYIILRRSESFEI